MKAEVLTKNEGKIVIIAPSNSMYYIDSKLIEIGQQKLSKIFNLEVVFSQYSSHQFLFTSSTPENRVLDIHRALRDTSTRIIMAAYGGYNTNDILPYLDYELIQESDVPFVGYSDITILLNAIYAKTGKMAILGPSFTTFCDPNIFEESVTALKDILERKNNVTLTSSSHCACDKWFLKDNFGPREIYSNQRWKIFKEGVVQTKLVGGNLESYLKLFGTEYFPVYENHVLLVEANSDEPPGRFLRDLIHLKQLGILKKISGLIVGQFHKDSLLSSELMSDMLSYALQDYSYPVIYNANFSHIDPLLALPIGGEIILSAEPQPKIIVYPT